MSGLHTRSGAAERTKRILIELDVTAVVVAQCHEYEDVEPQAAPTPTRAPRGGDDEASAEASADPTGEPVDCEYPSAPPLGGGEH